MRQCSWIRASGQSQAQGEIPNTSVAGEFIYPEATPSRLKEWAMSIKQQENAMMTRRRNASNVNEQVEIRETETLTLPPQLKFEMVSGTPTLATEAPKQDAVPSSIAKTVQSVADDFSLNEQQRIVYDIIAEKFVNQCVLRRLAYVCEHAKLQTVVCWCLCV